MNRAVPVAAIAGDTVDSWKAIAAYLSRDVRTVVRWESSRGLPVHRIPGGGRAGVFAFKSELDAWRNGTRPYPLKEARDKRTIQPSIAVLPFSNLSSDNENEYFSDGLADEIITV